MRRPVYLGLTRRAVCFASQSRCVCQLSVLQVLTKKARISSEHRSPMSRPAPPLDPGRGVLQISPPPVVVTKMRVPCVSFGHASTVDRVRKHPCVLWARLLNACVGSSRPPRSHLPVKTSAATWPAPMRRVSCSRAPTCPRGLDVLSPHGRVVAWPRLDCSRHFGGAPGVV